MSGCALTAWGVSHAAGEARGVCGEGTSLQVLLPGAISLHFTQLLSVSLGTNLNNFIYRAKSAYIFYNV